MSTPANIPGFYYDPEKKKYFRLQPHHLTSTQSNTYSSSTVLQQEREKKRADAEAKEAERLCARKRRAPLKNNPYYSATLFRELGVKPGHELLEDRKRIYARGLTRNHVFEVEPGSRIAAFVPYRTEDGGREMVVCTASGRGGDIRRIPLVPVKDTPITADKPHISTLTHSWSRSTSVTISTRSLLVSTLLGSASASIYLTRLHPASGPTPSSPAFELTTTIDQLSLWTTAASPHPTGHLLIGASASAILLTELPHDVHYTHYPIPSDVFACEFSPTSPHTFYAGSRDGAVRVFDIRARPSKQECKGIVVRHGSTITHLRATSEVGLLVNGLQGTALYDMRWPHPGTPSAKWKEPTRASVEFTGLKREDGYVLDLGFDVNIDIGTVAVANQEGRVGLWSLATGDRLGEIGSTRKQPVKALRFSAGRLWLAEQGALDAWEY